MNTPADMSPPPRPRYDGGWRIAVVYFGLVSLGFSQPLFNTTLLFRREFHLGLFDAVLIVFVFQYLTAAVLAGARHLMRAPYARLGFDFIIIAAAALVLIRQVQLIYLKTGAFSGGEKLIMLGGMIIGAVIAAVVIRRFLTVFVFYAGLVSPVFGIFFLHAVINHDLPLGSGAPEAPPPGGGPTTVLLVLDGLSLELLRGPDGGVDARDFPNIARLAARGIWWKNAVTNHPVSRLSFPSFLTSKFPHSVIPDVAKIEYDLERLPARSLFGVFRESGHRIHVYSDYLGCAGRRLDCTSHLDARRPGFLLNTFAKFVEEFGPEFMTDRFFPVLHARRLHTEREHLIKTLRTAGAGEFHLAHLMGTHWPYVLNADGSYKFSPHWRFLPGVDFDAVFKNYRDQTRYVDGVIGEALDAIDSRPDDQPLILMLIADHGECWTADCPGIGYRDLIHTIPSSWVSIPAMLLSPLHEPRIDEDDFQLIDVAPTLCEAAGLKGCGDYGFDGVSRLNNPPPPRPRRFFLDPARPSVDIPLPARSVPAPPIAAAQAD